MNERDHPSIYELLPRVLRLADEAHEFELRSLIEALEVPLRDVGVDLRQFADDLFIETCAEDLVAYFGDLVDAPDGATREQIANRLLIRRRPGTLDTLVQIARDASGCPVEGVEGRDAHSNESWVELVVYTTAVIPIVNLEATPLGAGRFSIDPVGGEGPLIRDPADHRPGDGPYTPRPLHLSDDAATIARHLRVEVDGHSVSAARLVPTDLSEWRRPPDSSLVFVDPVRRRIAFAERQAGPVRIDGAILDAGRVPDFGVDARVRQAIAEFLPLGLELRTSFV